MSESFEFLLVLEHHIPSLEHRLLALSVTLFLDLSLGRTHNFHRAL